MKADFGPVTPDPATGAALLERAYGARKMSPCSLEMAGLPTMFPCGARTLSAHVLRSPHAHAVIRGIDKTRALAMPGVHAVITGEEIRRLSDPFLLAVKEPMPQWSLAAERVRYFGEPVAVVLASNRYLAEDAATAVEIDYEPLSAVIDPLEAIKAGAPRLHDGLPGNEIGPRNFVYGDPEIGPSRRPTQW